MCHNLNVHSPITRNFSAPTTTSWSSAEKSSFPALDFTSSILPRAWTPWEPDEKYIFLQFMKSIFHMSPQKNLAQIKKKKIFWQDIAIKVLV